MSHHATNRSTIAAVSSAAVLVALALAPTAAAQSGCGGLLQPACPTVEQAELSLEPSRRVVPASGSSFQRGTEKVVLRGRVTGVEDPAGLVVQLRTRYPDYDQTIVRERTVSPRGTFKFTSRPQANAIYRASLAPDQRAAGVSPLQGVVVTPEVEFVIGEPTEKAKVLFGVYVRMLGSVQLPGNNAKDPRPRGGKAIFYAVRGKKATRIGDARMKHEKFSPGTDCSYGCEAYGGKSLRINGPMTKAETFFVCLPKPAFDGFGLPDRSCGDRRLRLRQ